ncbi:MAG: hypothetical protein IJO03_06060 [Clostridia bacterium]|nr:hypothetical protein [Clostridia bacterium]
MISDILSEFEFKKRFFKWLLDNKRGFYLDSCDSVEEYARLNRLPEFNYVHTQSLPDENGDLTTLLKTKYQLRDWQTKSGRHHAEFEFYLVLKTYLDRVEDGPVEIGYITVD